MGKTPAEVARDRAAAGQAGGVPQGPPTGARLGNVPVDPTGIFTPSISQVERRTGKQAFRRWLADSLGGDLVQVDEAPDGTETRSTEGTPMVSRGSGTGTSVDDILMSVTRMSEAQISHLQRRLFQAGFYGSSVYGNAAEISWGMIDAPTQTALQNALGKATVNQVENFDQFLENEKYRFAQDGIAGDGGPVRPNGGARGSEQSVIDIVLEDPESLKIMAEEAGTELLGRKPTEKEIAAITAKIHARQREQQTRRQQPVGGGEDGLAAMADSEVASLMGGESGLGVPQAAGREVRLDAEQASVVNTIINVAQQMGLGEEYIVAGISAGMVESGLRNLSGGDRDSVGVFQQRPSQGWGSPSQIRDVNYAARKFFEAMLRTKNPGDLGTWVADTQRPAKQYRGRYGEMMGEAADILAYAKGSRNQTTNPNGPGAAISPAQAERLSKPTVTPNAGQGRKAKEGGGTFGRGPAPKTSPTVTAPANPIRRADDPLASGSPWYNALANSMSDPIFRESFNVDPSAMVEAELRRMDPKAYETKQVAQRTIEFLSMLGSGGGFVSEQG